MNKIIVNINENGRKERLAKLLEKQLFKNVEFFGGIPTEIGEIEKGKQ